MRCGRGRVLRWMRGCLCLSKPFLLSLYQYHRRHSFVPMAFRPANAQGRQFYAQAASNAPSTTSLLPPRGPHTVQAAFARAPPSIRSVSSLTSLVRLSFPLRAPLTLAQNDSPYSGAAAGRPFAGQGQSISDKARPSPPHFLTHRPSPSSLSLLTPSPGVPIFPQTTQSQMIFSTTPIHAVIEGAIVAAVCSPTEV